MTHAELLAAIDAAASASGFVADQILNRIPWVFEGDATSFTAWRTEVAETAKVQHSDVYIVGSAATGYSWSPLKSGRDFARVSATATRVSDIDVAIVSMRLVTEGWNTLVIEDRNRRLLRLLRPKGDLSAEDQLQKLRSDVYWGTVAHAHTVPGSRIGARIRLTLAAITRRAPLKGHLARIRIYRRHVDLAAYHEQSIRRLVFSLRNPGAGR
jgi:hypothetical protein